MRKIRDFLEEKGIYLNKAFFLEHKEVIIRTIIVILVAIVLIMSFFQDGGKEKSKETEENQITESEELVEEEVNTTVIVDISGSVENPMVAELPQGSRIDDAIEVAGGLSKDADIKDVNRAEILQDGQKIFIPSKGENTSINNSSEESSSASVNPATKVNINSATSEELQRLKGVGPATAEKIIVYRGENGKFKKIEDLKKVKGIGEKTFDNLKDNICV